MFGEQAVQRIKLENSPGQILFFSSFTGVYQVMDILLDISLFPILFSKIGGDKIC